MTTSSRSRTTSQPVLEEVRKTIRKVLPDAEEVISYNIPTFTIDGRYLVYFAGWQKHVSIYPIPGGDESLEKELEPYRTGPGTLRFPLNTAACLSISSNASSSTSERDEAASPARSDLAGPTSRLQQLLGGIRNRFGDRLDVGDRIEVGVDPPSDRSVVREQGQPEPVLCPQRDDRIVGEHRRLQQVHRKLRAGNVGHGQVEWSHHRPDDTIGQRHDRQRGAAGEFDQESQLPGPDWST